MIRALLIAVCLGIACCARAAGDSPPLETRIYRLSSTCPLFPSADRAGVTNLQTRFEQDGVVFGSASAVIADNLSFAVAMRNLAAEHEKLGRLLQRLDPNTPQFVADIVVVEFRPDELLGPDSTNLVALWQAGKGTRVAATKVVVKSGVAALPSDSREEKYPEPADPSDVAPLPSPGSFETREVGLSGNFTPMLWPDDKTILLWMSIGWSWHSGTNLLEVEFGGEGTRLVTGRPSVMIPVDHRANWFAPNDGETFVLGAPAIPGESAQPYLFATFHIIDASGRKPGTSPVEMMAIDGPTAITRSTKP